MIHNENVKVETNRNTICSVVVREVRHRWLVRSGEQRFRVSSNAGTVLGFVESDNGSWRAWVARISRPQPFCYPSRDVAIASLIAGSQMQPSWARIGGAPNHLANHLVLDGINRAACGAVAESWLAPRSSRHCLACEKAFSAPVVEGNDVQIVKVKPAPKTDPVSIVVSAPRIGRTPDGLDYHVHDVHLLGGAFLGTIDDMMHPNWHASTSQRGYVRRIEALRALIPGSVLTTPRWASFAHHSKAHWIAPSSGTAPCGTKAHLYDWRMSATKPHCRSCERIMRASS